MEEISITENCLLPFYVSRFDCTESMTEAFEHLCKSHDDFSCKGSSSNYDGDGMADVAAKLTEKSS